MTHAREVMIHVVTGASRGVGQAIASSLLYRGEQVIGWCRSKDGVPADASHHSVDLTNQQDVLDAAAALSGDSVLLWNVAGKLHDGDGRKGPGRPETSAAAVTSEWMISTYKLNTVGPVIAYGALRGAGAKVKGVVNVSARVGSIADNRLGGWWSYRMSKAALNMATVNMAHELRSQGGWAVSIHPGTVDTAMSKPFSGKAPKVTAHEAAHNIMSVVDGLSPGDDSGSFFGAYVVAHVLFARACVLECSFVRIKIDF